MRTTLPAFSCFASVLGMLALFHSPSTSAPSMAAAQPMVVEASATSEPSSTLAECDEVWLDELDQYGTRFDFVAVDPTFAHVYEIGCGQGRVCGTGAVEAVGHGNTLQEAIQAAYAALAKKLWPAAYGCRACGIPYACKPQIAYSADNPPTVNAYPDIAYNYTAKVSYSGQYLAVCTPCE